MSPEAIKRRRQALLLTQRELADMVGTSAAYIAHIERGRATPSKEMEVRISLVGYPQDETERAIEHMVNEYRKSFDGIRNFNCSNK